MAENANPLTVLLEVNCQLVPEAGKLQQDQQTRLFHCIAKLLEYMPSESAKKFLFTPLKELEGSRPVELMNSEFSYQFLMKEIERTWGSRKVK